MPEKPIDPTDMQPMFNAVRSWAKAVYGDYYDRATIIVRIRGTTRKTILPVPLLPGLLARPVKTAPEPTEMERDILQAVAEYRGAEPLTGEKLAPLVGYEFSAHFRRSLAALMRAGQLANDRPGYRLPNPSSPS